MSDAAKAHYRFNVQLLDPLLYMELKGMHYDKALALEEQAKVHVAMQECGNRLLVRFGPRPHRQEGLYLSPPNSSKFYT